MAEQVKIDIVDAISFYTRKDNFIFIHDIIVNQSQKSIDEICFNILIRERPFVKDLQEIIAIVKLVLDIKRIADHAFHFAE